MSDLKQKLLGIAEVLDTMRIMPRIFIAVYIVLLYDSVQWFMALDDPSNAQAGLVSIMSGVGAAWFSAYVNSGKK